jgi:hypothetical protein
MAETKEQVDLAQRRKRITPAADEHIDPAEPGNVAAAAPKSIPKTEKPKRPVTRRQPQKKEREGRDQVNTRITWTTLDLLDELHAQSGRSKQDIIEDAVADYCRAHIK